MGTNTVGETLERTAPQRTMPRASMAERIRAVADLADAECPDYRRIAHDLWALRVEATREADTLDARLIDTLCKL